MTATNRRWPRWSLRTLFVVVTVLALLWWWALTTPEIVAYSQPFEPVVAYQRLREPIPVLRPKLPSDIAARMVIGLLNVSIAAVVLRGLYRAKGRRHSKQPDAP